METFPAGRFMQGLGSFVIADLFSDISGAAVVFRDYFALSPAAYSYMFIGKRGFPPER